MAISVTPPICHAKTKCADIAVDQTMRHLNGFVESEVADKAGMMRGGLSGPA